MMCACRDKAELKEHCTYCRCCHAFTERAETQTVAAFSLGLRDALAFRARCSSEKLWALLLG